jgi:hypothetical protein
LWYAAVIAFSIHLVFVLFYSTFFSHDRKGVLIQTTKLGNVFQML